MICNHKLASMYLSYGVGGQCRRTWQANNAPMSPIIAYQPIPLHKASFRSWSCCKMARSIMGDNWGEFPLLLLIEMIECARTSVLSVVKVQKYICKWVVDTEGPPRGGFWYQTSCMAVQANAHCGIIIHWTWYFITVAINVFLGRRSGL